MKPAITITITVATMATCILVSGCGGDSNDANFGAANQAVAPPINPPPPPGDPRCGNGVIDTGEQCDGAAMPRFRSCKLASPGFTGGLLGCRSDCTYDTSACTSTCGDGIRSPAEVCDGSDVGQQSCTSLGLPFYGGALKCDGSCQLDTSSCHSVCAPAINELQSTGATASDEFVELYNPCEAPIALDRWKIVYRSAGNNGGNVDFTIAALASTHSIAGRGFFVVGGNGWSGIKDAALTSGLAAAGGAVGLRDPEGRLVDSVAYETLTTSNAFTETAPAPNPAAWLSIQRSPGDGTDTDDNSKDFHVAAPTPGAANR